MTYSAFTVANFQHDRPCFYTVGIATNTRFKSKMKHQPLNLNPMLNRSAVLVRPAKPYIDWTKSLPDADSVLPSVDGEQTVFLIEVIFGKDHLNEVLSEVFDEIFESRLADWCFDESLWLTNRTFAMFKDWFTIECHSVVIDLLNEPLESDS